MHGVCLNASLDQFLVKLLKASLGKGDKIPRESISCPDESAGRRRAGRLIHIPLLEVCGKTVQMLVIRQDGIGLSSEEVVVPDS